MRVLFCLLLLALATGLAGCASSSAVRTGKRYEPLQIEEVQVFLEQPTFEYEVVGLVTGHSMIGMTQNSDVNRAFRDLKKQAASLGANGVIVSSVVGPQGQTAGVGVASTGQTGAFFAGGADSEATVNGMAIRFVGEEAQ